MFTKKNPNPKQDTALPTVSFQNNAGITIALNLLRKGADLYPDFQDIAPCPHCNGHPDPDSGKPLGGTIFQEIPALGRAYPVAYACPHCAFGAWNHHSRKVAYPKSLPF